MGELLAYSFCSSLVMMLLYLVYRIVKAPDNYPSFNRWLLWSIYAVALSAPAVSAWAARLFESSDNRAEILIAIENIGSGEMVANDAPAIDYLSIILWIYFAGMGIATIMTAISFIRIFLIIHRGTSFYIEKRKVILTEWRNIAPFSFGKYIVIPAGEQSDNMHMIMLHERSHIELGHWIDLLIARTVCIFQWYNPAAWLMQSELRNIHEYQADNGVIESGADIRQYQLLLIEKAVGARFPSLANSLNHSKLKKRITMMCKNQKKPRVSRLLRPLMLLPALGTALWLIHLPAVAGAISSISGSSLARPVNASPDGASHVFRGEKSESNPAFAATEESSRKVTNFISEPGEKSPQKSGKESSAPRSEVEESAEYPGGLSALMQFLKANIRYPENSDAYGRVIVRFVVEADGSIGDVKIMKSVSPELDAEAERVVKMMPRWTPGKVDGKAVASYFVLPVSFMQTSKPAADVSASVKNEGNSKSTSMSSSVSTSTDADGKTSTTVVITSNSDDNPMQVSYTSSAKNQKDYTIYVDGKKYEGDLTAIPSSEVESMSIDQTNDEPAIIRITLKK